MKENNIKNKIINYMQNKDSTTLKDIYAQNFGKPESVRGIINLEIKQPNATIIRTERGCYKLK